ncbi:MAG TPA: helix-turn-helix domain-containing protein [Mycobacteriales bacterium]|jgi:AcrR family transcriptional regulator|nr:helix-turn-helix domain-containing protein [Mycobacteriales bacterium]
MTDLPTDGDRSGTRSRAGNNMSRSRAGILSGAAACLERYGPRKTTMADISREGGIAKATLYNHFRDKSEVYAALLEREVDEVLARVRDAMAKAVADAGHDRGSAPLAAALATAAVEVAGHRVLRRVVEAEPVLLAALVQPRDNVPWQRARELAEVVVGDAGAADLALRWVLSHAGWPADAGEVAAGAARLATALTPGADQAATPASG